MIFARKSDAALASLVKQLDELVAKHEDKELRVFVNLLGEDQEALEEQAKELAKKSEAKHIPIVVPVEFENGPENFGINPDAEVTVMLYSGIKVKANHTFGPGELKKEKGEKAILADVPKILEG
jgi:hypothetical protein